MRLLLIRHGESAHSQLDLVAGERGCPGLTPRGREQAHALRHRLAAEEEPADVLLSSTVPRAHETARRLAPALPSATGIRCVRALSEPDPGEGDGLTRERFAARYGSLDPRADPDRPLSPGGESWNAFVDRVRGTLAELPRRYQGRKVVAVTHAGFIVRAFLTLLAVPHPGTGARARVDPGFASITEWDYDESADHWSLLRFNDTAHLANGR
ncbi:histidine phosphatase family protein [Streptomyces sp. NPDC054796]